MFLRSCTVENNVFIQLCLLEVMCQDLVFPEKFVVEILGEIEDKNAYAMMKFYDIYQTKIMGIVDTENYPFFHKLTEIFEKIRNRQKFLKKSIR